MTCAAASVDGHYVAIDRDGELSLYTVEPFAEIARTALAPCATRVLAFVGRQILAYDTTKLTVLSPHKLAVVAQLALDTPARLLATSHHYALLSRGDELVVASCTNEGAAIAPMRTATSDVEFAAGLENARFLTWPKRGPAGAHAQMWEAATRLPCARVAFELPPDTIAVGTTGKHRSIWIATAGGDLITSRLSDGKATVAPLPKPPQAIASHPMSAWFVMDFDGEPHAVNSVLRSWQQLAIPAGRPRTLAPSIGSHAYVIVDEGDRVVRYEIGGDAIAKIDLPVGGPLPEADEPAGVLQATTPIARTKQVRVDTEPPERSVSERFGSRMKPIASPRLPKAIAWREALFEWAKLVGEAPLAPLPAGPSPLVTLAERAKLDVPAQRILHVLYADWIEGHGDVGVAVAKLVEVAGANAGQTAGQSAWDVALGSAQLGRHQLVASRVGRCVLARPCGTFLDGRDPEALARIDGNRSREVEPGAYRIVVRDGESDLDCARRVSTMLGTIGYAVDRADTARVEAWLRGWPLVGRHALAPRDGETIVTLVDSGADHGGGGPLL